MLFKKLLLRNSSIFMNMKCLGQLQSFLIFVVFFSILKLIKLLPVGAAAFGPVEQDSETRWCFGWCCCPCHCPLLQLKTFTFKPLNLWKFLGDPVVRILCSYRQRPRFNPWSGNQDPASCAVWETNKQKHRNLCL